MNSDPNIFTSISEGIKVKTKKASSDEKPTESRSNSEEKEKKRKLEHEDGSKKKKKKKPRVTETVFDSTFLPLIDEDFVSAFQPTFQKKKSSKKDGRSSVDKATTPTPKKMTGLPCSRAITPKKEISVDLTQETKPPKKQKKSSCIPALDDKEKSVDESHKRRASESGEEGRIDDKKAKKHADEKKEKNHSEGKDTKKQSDDRKEKKHSEEKREKKPIDWSKCPNCKIHKEEASKPKSMPELSLLIPSPDFSKLKENAAAVLNSSESKASDSSHLLAKLSRAAEILESTQKRLGELQKERDAAIEARNKIVNATRTFLTGYSQSFQEAQEGIEDLQNNHVRFLNEIASKHKQEKEMVQAVVRICERDKQRMKVKLEQKKEDIKSLRESLLEENKQCEEIRKEASGYEEKIETLQNELQSKPKTDPNARCSNCHTQKRLQEVLEDQLERRTNEANELRRSREQMEHKIVEKDRINRILTKDGERLTFELRNTKKECERQLEKSKSEWDYELDMAMREVVDEWEKKLTGPAQKIPSPPISDKSDANLPLTKAEMEHELSSVFEPFRKAEPENPIAIPGMEGAGSSKKSCSTLPTTSNTSSGNPFTGWGGSRPSSQDRKSSNPERVSQRQIDPRSQESPGSIGERKKSNSFAWGAKLSDSAKMELRKKLRSTLTKTLRASMDHPEARPPKLEAKEESSELREPIEPEEGLPEPLRSRRCSISWLRWQLDSSDDLISWYRGEVKSLTEAVGYFQDSLEDAQMAIEEDLVPSVSLDMKEAELAVALEKLRKEQDSKAMLEKELESKSAYAEMLRGNLLALSDSVNEFIGANGSAPGSGPGPSGPSIAPPAPPAPAPATTPFGSHCTANPSPFMNPRY